MNCTHTFDFLVLSTHLQNHTRPPFFAACLSHIFCFLHSFLVLVRLADDQNFMKTSNLNDSRKTTRIMILVLKISFQNWIMQNFWTKYTNSNLLFIDTVWIEKYTSHIKRFCAARETLKEKWNGFYVSFLVPFFKLYHKWHNTSMDFAK